MVKMKKSGLGLVIPKTLRIGGVTFYQRGGQVIGRVSESREKRSNTLAQFIQRQKMRHTTALWKMLRYAEPMFTERANAYQDFASLVSDEFADSTKGWALVRVIGDRCSPQTIQTRCTLYQQYMTDEALQRAAKSYGGITDKPFLSPR